jgi:FtsH-binding integral membrane protein
MAQYEITPERTFSTPYAADERITLFLRSVYGWMCAGLAITAIVAYAVAQSPTLPITIATNPFYLWGLILAQLGLVIFLSARIDHLSGGTAATLFALYSALTGVTFSFILLAYTGESIATTFMVCAGMFGALAFYGTTTRRSLAGWGQFLFMGLIGVVLASIVGIFWRNDGFQFILGFIGVIVFTGLTAYDAQRLKEMALAVPSGQLGSYAIAGALSLYLNFINLFLMLLRFLGNRRH